MPEPSAGKRPMSQPTLLRGIVAEGYSSMHGPQLPTGGVPAVQHGTAEPLHDHSTPAEHAAHKHSVYLNRHPRPGSQLA